MGLVRRRAPIHQDAYQAFSGDFAGHAGERRADWADRQYRTNPGNGDDARGPASHRLGGIDMFLVGHQVEPVSWKSLGS
jgi:hypothetical protein